MLVYKFLDNFIHERIFPSWPTPFPLPPYWVNIFFESVLDDGNPQVFKTYSKQLWSALQCVKSAQIRSFIWSVFSRIRTEYGDLQSPNMRKNGPERTPYLDNFNAVLVACDNVPLIKITKNFAHIFLLSN